MPATRQVWSRAGWIWLPPRHGKNRWPAIQNIFGRQSSLPERLAIRVFMPWLISLMGQLPLAHLAGESFTMITGVGLAYRDLERKPPEDFNAGPTEDPKDENVEMDPGR